MKKRARKRTPVRAALQPASTLQSSVQDGFAAVQRGNKKYVEASLRRDFGDSLDLDAAMQAAYPQDHRWDYLLGYVPNNGVYGLEPHSATSGETSVLIAKRKAALEQLASHMVEGTRVRDWLWVASGEVHFADTERTRRTLDENGIRFVGKVVKQQHLR